MTQSSWLMLTGGLLILGGFACSGETQTAANTESSSADGSSNDGSGSSSGGQATTGNDTTSDDGSGQSNGTGGTSSGSCPSVEPAVGTSCAPEGQACSFTNCVAPDYRDDHSVTCINGAWALTSQVTCNLNVASCPDSRPVQGQVCDPIITPGPCSVIDACGVVQVAYCTAGSGLWEFRSSSGAEDAPGVGGAATDGAVATTGAGIPEPEPPMCPVNPPLIGTACCPANYPEYCDYGAAGAGGSSGFAAPVPAAGGASSTTVSAASGTSTAIGSIVTVVGTTGSGGSGTGGGGGAPSVVECVVCGEDMMWVASDVCP